MSTIPPSFEVWSYGLLLAYQKAHGDSCGCEVPTVEFCGCDDQAALLLSCPRTTEVVAVSWHRWSKHLGPERAA